MILKRLVGIIKSHSNSFLVQLFVNILFICIYFSVSFFCLKFATINSSVSPIWPSTGLAISIIILFGRRYIGSIFLGALLANLLTAGPFINAVVIALGNSLEAFVGFYVYCSLNQYKDKFEHLSDLIIVTSCSLVAPIFSASIGVYSLITFKLIPTEIATNVWLTWWIADVMGAMLLLPLLLFFKKNNKREYFIAFHTGHKNFFPNLVLFLIITTTFSLFFSQSESLNYLYYLFPILILLTFIKSKLLIFIINLILASIAIFFTINGRGPFIISSFNQNILNLEIFLFTLAIANLVLANMNKFIFIKKIRILFLTGWIFWGTIFFILQTKHQSLESIAFNSITAEFENRIQEKISDYIQVLIGGRALFMASDDVSSLEWKSYVNSLNLTNAYEGMNGMGVVYKIHDDDLNHYLVNVKKEIDPNFAIKKVPSSLDQNSVNDKTHFIITYIEPFENNVAARGLDLGSELNRRTAAEKSIESGLPSLTDRIRLIQDKTKRFGFLVYLPIYKKYTNLNTPEERKLNFSHWIYAPFVTEKFLDTVFKKINNHNIVFQLYDSPLMKSSDLIYDFNSANINDKIKSELNSIQLGDKTFYIKWSRSKEYTTSNDLLSTWIGFIGVIMVLIVVLFIINVQNLEFKSKKLATKLNRDFLEAQKIVKEQEINIIQSNRLATLGEMASSIAHEINNPLAIISGNNQQLKKLLDHSMEIKESEKEKLNSYSLKIEKTVNRIDNIIKGLRLLSRDATNDQMSNVLVENLIDDTLSLCHEKFRYSKIELILNLNFKGEIFCRGTQISQVLINLLNNAHDAVMHLEEKWVRLEMFEEEQSLKILIVDSGHGIPPEIQEKILQPFFTTKEIGKGTGLGLSISKGIIEAHQGNLSISTLNGHTCFTITIPLKMV